MLYFVLFLFLIFSLIATVFAFSIIIGLIRTGGVPFISTPKKDFDNVLEAVDIKPGQVIYDLGCGNAGFLIRAAKKYGVRGVGYEISLWPYVWAKLKIWFNKSGVEVKMKDFFEADLFETDVVFCYLFPEVMTRLESKFEKELKPGSKLVSYAFKLPDREPDQEVVTNSDRPELGRIYVYKY